MQREIEHTKHIGSIVPSYGGIMWDASERLIKGYSH